MPAEISAIVNGGRKSIQAHIEYLCNVVYNGEKETICECCRERFLAKNRNIRKCFDCKVEYLDKYCKSKNDKKNNKKRTRKKESKMPKDEDIANLEVFDNVL